MTVTWLNPPEVNESSEKAIREALLALDYAMFNAKSREEYDIYKRAADAIRLHIARAA